MNWFNIYGDNKSITRALDELTLGETVKAEYDDRGKVSSIISNNRKGMFSVKQHVDEDGIKVLAIKRIANQTEGNRIPKVKTFIEEDTVGVLRIDKGKAYLNSLWLANKYECTVLPSILKRSQSFCEQHGLTLIY